MTLANRFPRLWREMLLVLLVALPWLSLLALGALWLWQGGYFWAWAVAAAALGLLARPLWRAVQQRSNEAARIALGNLAEPSHGWNVAERETWNEVLTIADTTPPFSFTEWNELTTVGQKTIDVVARHFHPGTHAAWAQFSLPEFLLLTERLSRDVRREALRHIPGVRAMRLSHVLWVQAQSERYGATAQVGWRVGFGVWRLVRAVLNPLQAAGQETSGFVLDKTARVLSLRLRTYLTRLLVLEIGRAAIELYSGRLTLSDQEFRLARERDLAGADTGPVIPVRILLAGQINAGKSSLLNALAQEARCAIGPLPTTSMAAEYLLERDGRPTAVIVDMPGLNDGTDTTADVLQLTARADLVLWVVSATRPARALDRRGLDALRAWANAQLTRRPPPMLLALTHVDQLHPAAEWAPPYDIVTPSTTKAEAIRSAIDAVARSLDFSPSAIVPVAMPHGLGTYNADALWARIALELDEAKLVQFDRLRVGHPAFSLRKILEQLNNAGRMIIKAIAKSQ